MGQHQCCGVYLIYLLIKLDLPVLFLSLLAEAQVGDLQDFWSVRERRTRTYASWVNWTSKSLGRSMVVESTKGGVRGCPLSLSAMADRYVGGGLASLCQPALHLTGPFTSHSLTPAEFMDLIVKNDEPAVARALTRGFNPNFQIEHITPIISASKRQCNGIVRLLKVVVSCSIFCNFVALNATFHAGTRRRGHQ